MRQHLTNLTCTPDEAAPATPPSGPRVGVAAEDPSPGSYGTRRKPRRLGDSARRSSRQESADPHRRSDCY